MIEKYQTINPSNGEVLGNYATLSETQLEGVIETVFQAQKNWKQSALGYRIDCIRKIKEDLDKNIEQYAALITTEMGKPITESRAEITKCGFLCDFYIKNARKLLADQPIHFEGLNAKRVFEPLGVIYTIMPWNFPFWQVFRSAIPSLLLGNGIILKHAENVIGSGYAIEAIIRKASGIDIFKNIVIDLALSPQIIKHKYIAAVTLTGSNRAGKIVAGEAGKVCKKALLELGGSDAYILRKDIDIEAVAGHIVSARMANAGQVCISPKRLIVDVSIKAAFENALIKNIKSIKIGDPKKTETMMGPMARRGLRDNVHRQVCATVDEGAKLLTGGQPVATAHADSLYYAPTVLTDVLPTMTAFKEEVFGPVICISVSYDDQEAVTLANASQYGLGGGIFTRDIALAEKIAKYDIEAGMCFINQCVTSHPALPFGGIKASGYGRECSSEAFRELANIKTVVCG